MLGDKVNVVIFCVLQKVGVWVLLVMMVDL